MIHEENRYFNWYHGYSEISLPVTQVDANDRRFLIHYIHTSASSGSISTQSFGEWLFVKFLIHSPNENTTAQLQLTLSQPKHIGGISWWFGKSVQDVDLFTEFHNINISNEDMVQLKRFGISFSTIEMSKDNIQNQDLKYIPELKFTWNYENLMKPYAKYKNEQINQEFVR